MPSLAPAFNQAFPEAPAGRLHTYEAGTTTPKLAYQDQAGLVAHVLPTAGVPLSGITLDANGRPPGGLFLASGEYTLHVYTAVGALVKSWDDVSAATALVDLADTVVAANGDAMVGVKHTGTGAVARTQHLKNLDLVNAADFGVTFDNVTDDTAAWNLAIAALGVSGGVVYGKNASTSYIGGANGLLVPANVTVDLCGGTLRGTGNSSGANTIINTAYYNAGALTINTLSNAVTQACVRNGILYRAAYGMQLRYAIDECRFESLTISECYNGIYAQFCLYSSFRRITYRNTSTGTAYRFSNNCNALTLQNVYAIGTNPGTVTIGFQFDAKTYAVKMLNCSSEYCLTGIKTEEVHGLDIDGHYFEQCATRGIDLQGSAAGRKAGVRVASCFFGSTAVLVYGRTVNDFVWEASNDRAADCVPGSIDLDTDTSITTGNLSVCTGVVRLNRYDLQSVAPTTAALPTWLTLSNGMEVEAVAAATRNGGFATPVIAKAALNTNIAPMVFSGFGGASFNAGDQLKPFQTVTFSGPVGSFNVIIDTSIDYCDYGFLIFRFDISDNISTYKIHGRCYGTDVYSDAAAGKTITVTNNAGKVRVTVGTFDHPAGTASVASLVRHV